MTKFYKNRAKIVDFSLQSILGTVANFHHQTLCIAIPWKVLSSPFFSIFLDYFRPSIV